ncbi:MAG: DUF438 domain-containing protein [Planctomycetaceae bacterium]|nr:DUF438 domain-containing protein [Planctomycetaceae bacterium]
MDKITKSGLAEELTGFLVKLSEGKNKAGLRKQANRLIAAITPDDIESAERTLIMNGYTVKKIQQLSAAFVLMGVLGGDDAGLRSRLPEQHILRKIMAEHEMIRCFLADLEDVAGSIEKSEQMNASSCEIMRLHHIAEHLHALDEHLDREDDIIYPALKEKGWKSLFSRIESEHVYIQMSINDLVKLAMSFGKMPFPTFKARLLSSVRYLCPLLREHLFHEDRVLFPLAFTMVENNSVWDRLRQICNEIDYCGIHL